MNEEHFWDDPKAAQNVIRQCNGMKELEAKYHQMEQSLASLQETVDELNQNFDEELKELLDMEYQDTLNQFEDFEVMVLLSHPYDKNNAILELHPGAGGTESQDWASMLYRMYCRWAERKGYKVTLLDYQEGEEAGIKSVSILIEGDMAYGYLKAEKGVHRLVRISPFDSSGRRHTSFASLDVMPQFSDEIEITIDERDLDVVTMRASGAGGQHINKTDSAVRMTHKPTGIVVSSQTSRDQVHNRENCMRMLRAKLVEMREREREEKMADIKGEMKKIEWGSQIRSYVFHPYSLVKDHRTGYETSNVDAVMDGELDGFITAYLQMQ